MSWNVRKESRTSGYGSIAVVVAVVALVSATPATAFKSQQAAFKVEVHAVQESDWTLDSTDYDGCVQGNVRTYGSGAQQFSVTTRKPVKLTATYNKYGDFESTDLAVAKGLTGVPVNGAAIREGSITHEQLSGGASNCGGGDGDGYVPPPPDCGSRSFNGVVPLEYHFPSTYPAVPTPLVPVLVLSGPFGDDGYSSSIRDLWTNCPGGALGDELFPTPFGSLPLKKLFGKKERFSVKIQDELINEGSGSGDFYEVIRMNWKVSFERRVLRP